MTTTESLRGVDIVSLEAEIGKRSLREFVKMAWQAVEPGTPFKASWHLDCITDHLEACPKGQIPRLIINIPPRHTKSLTTAVFWPAWEWTRDPSICGLYTSYAQPLSIRDSIKCRRLIQSPWYKERWGRVFHLVDDQNQKQRFENNYGGYRLASSVEGGNTGEGAERIVCLWYNTLVTTNMGRMPIGEIVDKRLPVRVLGFNDTPVWQEIKEYESNPGKASVRVILNDGRHIDATTDHPFFVIGRGYIKAGDLLKGDEVRTDESILSGMCERDQPQTVGYERQQKRSVLWETLFPPMAQPKTHGCSLCSVWKDGNESCPGSSCAKHKGSVLQSRMSRKMANRVKQPCVDRWASGTNMPSLFKALFRRSETCEKRTRNVLFFSMQAETRQRKPHKASEDLCSVCLLREGNENYRTQSRTAPFLFSPLRQFGTSQFYLRGKQWALCAWAMLGKLPARISACIPIGERPGWASLYPVFAQGGQGQSIRCSPYQLRQDAESFGESGKFMSMVSRFNAWVKRESAAVDKTIVKSVVPIPTPGRVYNLRVDDAHNYFANGVLVHNCDDPHNVVQGESDVMRQNVLTWWDEVMSTRFRRLDMTAWIIIMQRVHQMDLTGYCLEQGGWHHLCLPEEYEPRIFSFSDDPIQAHDACEIYKDPRQSKGELLCPQRFSEKELETFRLRMGPYAYAAQFQQRPAPREGALFNDKWFAPLPDDFDQHYPDREDSRSKREKLRIVQFWDLAFSSKGTADYTAAVTVGLDEDFNIYILHVFRARIGEESLPLRMAEVIAHVKPHAVGIEQNNFRRTAIQDIIKSTSDVLTTKMATATVVLPVDIATDKGFNAMLVSERAKAGKVYADRSAPWWRDFIMEFIMFPKGTNDDQVDACAGAFKLVVEATAYMNNHRTKSYGWKATMSPEKRYLKTGRIKYAKKT